MFGSEKRYINETLNGDINAFGKLVEMHQSFAYRTAISLVKSEADASDVVQESFITAYEKLYTFRQDCKFSSWMCRIVINKSLQFIRKKNIRVTHEQINEHIQNVDVNKAIVHLEKKDLEKTLKKALAKINPKEALVIQLFYLEEFSIIEIKELTGFTTSNIKVLLHRGRIKLYNQLNKLIKDGRR